MAVTHWIGGVRVRCFGDAIRPEDRCLILLNHRTRHDWLHIWHHLITQRCESDLKIMLKAALRHVPGLGWAIQNNCYLLISRSWNSDRAMFARYLDLFATADHRTKLLVFPEGTDFDDETQERSHRYADKSGLQRYFFCLHPRTTGFVYLLKKLALQRRLDAVYDVTVVYPENCPHGEIDMALGDFPRQVWFSIKRHSVRELCEPLMPTPTANGLLPANGASPANGLLRHEAEDEDEDEDEEKEKAKLMAPAKTKAKAKAWALKTDEALGTWLQEVWARKERLLYETYAALGLRRERDLPAEWSSSAELRDGWWVRPAYLFYLAYWAGFLYVAYFLVTRSAAFDWYLGLSSIAYVCVTIVFGGTDKLQIYRCNPGYTTAEVPERVLVPQLPDECDCDRDRDRDDDTAAAHTCSPHEDGDGNCSSSSNHASTMPLPAPPLDLQKGLNAALDDTERALRLREINVALH